MMRRRKREKEEKSKKERESYNCQYIDQDTVMRAAEVVVDSNEE